MKKKLKKAGTNGLMAYFTKEEKEIYSMEEGDPVDIDEDQFLKRKEKKS